MYYSIEESRNIIFNNLDKNKYFSVIRFNEGEIRILSKRKHDNKFECVCRTKEWCVNEIEDNWFFEDLTNTFLYENETYFKFVQDQGFHENLKYVESIFSNEKIHSVTSFYTIFLHFYKNFVSYFNKYESINFICNKNANLKNINLNIKNVWNKFDTFNSWKQTEYLNNTVQEILKFNNSIFLFTTGFSTKLMICKLHNLNKNNIYIDCGSIFDKILYNKKTRSGHIVDHEFIR